MIVDDEPYAEIQDIANVWALVGVTLIASLHVTLTIKHS